jgi:predicted Holliday junction resolvase-like endonuclease
VNDPLATLVLIAALAALVWIAIAYARYRAVYRYDDDDLQAARRDASKRSRSVLGGKAGEQLVPLVPAFSERFDPTEARFLGAPIDYVIFDGIGTGELREVVLVEVKTGGSRLSPNERQVELAVAEGRVAFEVLRLP